MSFSEDFSDSHEIFSKSTGLIRADVISTTHCFTGLEISD
jgi:hypothetical protein